MSKLKVILDTDMENEIDDKFTLAHLLGAKDLFDFIGITIAPFSNSVYLKTDTIEQGSVLSYKTTENILRLADVTDIGVYMGAINYFEVCQTNPAVQYIIDSARKYEHITILAIGVITNIALAIKLAPDIVSKIRVMWLGGNTLIYNENDDFNFVQDIEAVRYVFASKVDLVLLPCHGVASHLLTTKYEFDHYCDKDNPLHSYLSRELHLKVKDYIGRAKVMWDMAVSGYLINQICEQDWFEEMKILCPQILADGRYSKHCYEHQITYVYYLDRNMIFKDFYTRLINLKGRGGF